MKIQELIHKSVRLILEGRFDNQEMVDAILDKIANQGIESLTSQERELLDNPNATPEPNEEENWDDYELSHEEEQEDEVLVALSQLQFDHGVSLNRVRVKGIDNKGNEYPYIKFIDDNGNHIMNLEERVYIRHDGGEEAVGTLKVDNNLWSKLFSLYEVNEDNRTTVFQKYLGEMYGYDIEKAEPVELSRR